MQTAGYMPLYQREAVPPALIFALDCSAFAGLPNGTSITSWTDTIGGVILTGTGTWSSFRAAVGSANYSIAIFYSGTSFSLEIYYYFAQYAPPTGTLVLNGTSPNCCGIGHKGSSAWNKAMYKGTTLCLDGSYSGDAWSRIRCTHNESASPKSHFYNNGVEVSLTNYDVSVPTPSGLFTVSSPSIVYIQEVKMWNGVVAP